jgi:hypothetical protein
MDAISTELSAGRLQISEIDLSRLHRPCGPGCGGSSTTAASWALDLVPQVNRPARARPPRARPGGTPGLVGRRSGPGASVTAAAGPQCLRLPRRGSARSPGTQRSRSRPCCWSTPRDDRAPRRGPASRAAPFLPNNGDPDMTAPRRSPASASATTRCSRSLTLSPCHRSVPGAGGSCSVDREQARSTTSPSRCAGSRPSSTPSATARRPAQALWAGAAAPAPGCRSDARRRRHRTGTG